MKSRSKKIKYIFMNHLIKKGIETDMLPFFLRDLRTSFSIYPLSDHKEIGNVINQLGWDDIELDYQTFQLAKTYFDTLRSVSSRDQNSGRKMIAVE